MLTERLTRLLQSDLSPTCSSAAYAIMIDGEIVAEDSMGRNPIRGGTYNVGSISKVYCAVAVMQLVEKGLLDLDRPIFEYLPRFTMLDERFRQITLRQCLSHSCALPGTQWRWFAAATPRRDYYEEVYQSLRHSALHSDPGWFSTYCNDGFTMAEMVVSEVAGMDYGVYCKEYITEPIGAHSSRQSSQRNPNYPHTYLVGMPPESIGPEGAGGIGTTMADLCKFGQLFLTETEIISKAGKAEINRPQGATFLPEDEWSRDFGLGWDCVNMPHSQYDLGDGVLEKGGSTQEFYSRLIVIPKYRAVLALSATTDCGIDVKEEILQLFAQAMLDRGVNIWKGCKPVSARDKELYEGLYLTSGRFLRVRVEGPRMDIFLENTLGESQKLYENLLYNGEDFSGKVDYRFSFVRHGDLLYLMESLYGRRFPLAVKADGFRLPPLPEVWEKRVGKSYIISNALPDDIVGGFRFNGITLRTLPELPNVIFVSITPEQRPRKNPPFEIALIPSFNGRTSDQLLCGFLPIPYMGGRDQLNFFFEGRERGEVCHCSGYLYQDVSALDIYQGQAFGGGGLNQVYALGRKLERLPEIPEGRRILVFNEELSVVYDSLMNDTFQPVEKGYISLI